MPWCPKCQNKFREGVSVCPDCNVKLVDELKEEDRYIPFFQAERKSIAEKLAKYFEYSGLKSSIKYDKANQIYILLVPAQEENQAKKLYQAFYFVEREQHEKELKEHGQESDEGTGEVDEGTEEDEVPVSEENPPEEAVVSDENPSEEAIDSEESLSEEAIDHSQTSDEQDTWSITNNQDSDTADGTSGSYNTEVDEAGSDITEPDTDTNAKGTDFEYYNADSEDEIVKNGDDEDSFEDETAEEADDSEPSTYVMKAEQFKDYNATVWVFLITGIAGLIFVLLNAAKILTILSGPFPNIIMGILFLFFIYIGLSTNNKAKKIQKEIDAENELTEKINLWLKENVTGEFLASIRNNIASNELNYINEAETIRNMLIEKFGEQNHAYLDRLIDDFYSANFDREDPSEDA